MKKAEIIDYWLSSSDKDFKLLKALATLKSAISPPATIPSSSAARVALTASSILNFFSFNS